jgi:hypothetical protein
MDLIKDIGDVHNQYRKFNEERRATIKKAIDASYTMISLDEFIRVTGCYLPDIMDLSCIYQYRANVPVLITPKLVESFGYKGNFRSQKASLIKLVNAHKFPYIALNNDEYNKFTCMPEATRIIASDAQLAEGCCDDEAKWFIEDLYPPLHNPNGKATHILIMPEHLHKLMMVVNTSCGDLMRDFCYRLTGLFDLYGAYQNQYKDHQMIIKDKHIDDLIHEFKDMGIVLKESVSALGKTAAKLEVATVDRIVKTDSANKNETFILLKINEVNSKWEYYAVKNQRGSSAYTLSRLKSKYPLYTELLRLPYEPNSTSLFGCIKEKLRDHGGKIAVHRNLIRLLPGYTEDMFVKDIEKISRSRHSVSLPDT